MKDKIALITGATAGIGEATAVKLAKEGMKIIINGRRSERLKTLKDQLEKNYKTEVLSLVFDVRYHEDVNEKINSLSESWKNISVLVNNAGLAMGLSLIQDGDVADWDVMIDTNIKGLLNVTRAVVPAMIEKKEGHIINLSSVAGKTVYQRGNIYCSTKHAVDALSESMRIDMLEHKIKVTNISPGAVETEFSIVRFKGNTERAKVAYTGYQPLSAEDIADTIWFALSRPQHVNISEITITPLAQANVHYISKKIN